MNFAAHHFDELLADGESEPRAAGTCGMERIEQTRDLLLGDTGAIVLYGEADRHVEWNTARHFTRGRARYIHPHVTRVARMLQRIQQQVEYCAMKQVRVAMQRDEQHLSLTAPRDSTRGKKLQLPAGYSVTLPAWSGSGLGASDATSP